MNKIFKLYRFLKANGAAFEATLLASFASKSEKDLRYTYDALGRVAAENSGATDNEKRIALQAMEKMRSKYPNIDFEGNPDFDPGPNSQAKTNYDDPFFTEDIEELLRRYNAYGSADALEALNQRGVDTDWVNEIIREERMLHGLPAPEQPEYNPYDDYDTFTWKTDRPYKEKDAYEILDEMQGALEDNRYIETDDFGYKPSEEEFILIAMKEYLRKIVSNMSKEKTWERGDWKGAREYRQKKKDPDFKPEYYAPGLDFLDELVKSEVPQSLGKFQNEKGNVIIIQLRKYLEELYGEIVENGYWKERVVSNKYKSEEIKRQEYQRIMDGYRKGFVIVSRFLDDLETELGGRIHPAYQAWIKEHSPWLKQPQSYEESKKLWRSRDPYARNSWY